MPMVSCFLLAHTSDTRVLAVTITPAFRKPSTNLTRSGKSEVKCHLGLDDTIRAYTKVWREQIANKKLWTSQDFCISVT